MTFGDSEHPRTKEEIDALPAGEAGATVPAFSAALPHWQYQLEDRELSHVAFCERYAEQYKHGAPDHLSMIVIAKLAHSLRQFSSSLANGGHVVIAIRDEQGLWRDNVTGVRIPPGTRGLPE